MKKRLFLVFILFISLFITTGCNTKKVNKVDNKAKKEVKEEKINLVGKYTLIEVNDGKTKYTKEDFKNLLNYDKEVTLELKEDKTGVIDIFGEKQELKYNNKTITINDEKITFTYLNDTITFEKSGTSLKFEKIKEN